MIRLLHSGVPDDREGARPLLAAPLSPEQLASSPLCPAALAEKRAFVRPSDPGPNPVAYLELEESPNLSQQPFPPVYLCGTATSSLDVARTLGVHGMLPIWGSVLVLNQTTGRGQLGRSWSSPAGNIYAALRLPFLPPFTETAAAPAIGGLLAEALAELGCPVRIKWPNDLVRGPEEGCSDWNKIGGILLEERPLHQPVPNSPSEASLLVAGIGLNIISAPHADEMRAGHAMPAGCLPMPTDPSGKRLPLVDFWTRLVRHTFFCYVNQIESKIPQAWRRMAERRLAFLGQPVLLVDGPGDKERHEGILEGLDEAGGLRLRGPYGCASFLSGSLR